MHRIVSSLFALILLTCAQHARAVFLDCVFLDGFENLGTNDAGQVAAVQEHNCARKTVIPAAATPIPSMTWSTAAATVAQNWANGCSTLTVTPQAMARTFTLT